MATRAFNEDGENRARREREEEGKEGGAKKRAKRKSRGKSRFFFPRRGEPILLYHLDGGIDSRCLSHGGSN